MPRWFLVLPMLCLVVACAPLGPGRSAVLPTAVSGSVENTDVAETSVPLVDESQGAVVGVIRGQRAGWKDRDISVYLCPYYGTESGTEGFYILEPSIHPSGEVAAAGDFQVAGVPPGKYAIVAGPTPEDSVPVTLSGHVRVVDVVAGQVLDLGESDLN